LTIFLKVIKSNFLLPRFYQIKPIQAKQQNLHFFVKLLMKFLTSLFLTIFLTFVFSATLTTETYACGVDCCKTEVKTQESNQSCCSSSSEDAQPCSEKNDCGGDCENNGCHCPQTITFAKIALISSDFCLIFPFFAPLSKADWYFQNTIPSAVYLSIWLPPKICC
jgi:hypothetical protein